ncbi:uncharacterized protein LDX57_006679 [Aspergillus melleus]|uniref:uncharacterized protein n=1 Tax=Aspergillus melleus TaxID=138277 RepID=UPI001E8CCC36|nr:uncharacterized protein LDX57_006679 [Aspergillus melleus]KAH8429008.1 hypothetical protein LDX57_006679 [Aspergillus melleus]
MAEKLAPKPLAPLLDSSRDDRSVPRRTNSSLACTACKVRKTKCDGKEPCERCIAKKTECFYDYNADQRRRINIKRKISTLEEDRDLLINLFLSLRNGSDSNAYAILNLIRSGPDLEELKSYIDARMKEGASPEIVEAHEALCGSQDVGNKVPRKVLSVKELVDQPPLQVPAKPWTSVTEDDTFVSHLISLYFTWYHPCFPWIDRELFIRDMKAENLDSKFCSPFLVNVLLADACAYSDYAEAYKYPKDPSTRGEHFYDEARKCLEEEKGRFTISTVQGLCGLSICAFLTGKDRVGWIFQGQLAFVAKELYNNTYDTSNMQNSDLTEEKRVRTSTLWGLYSITMASSMAYQKAPMIETPDVPIPKRDHEGCTDVWNSYPVKSDKISWHSSCHFGCLCDMAAILNDWCSLMFGGRKRPSLEDVLSTTNEVVRRLSKWEASLPECLRVENAVMPLPQVLCLHMYYHNALITVHGLAKTSKDNANDEKEAEPSDTNSQKAILWSARRIAKLMQQHRDSWGIDIFPASHIQWVTISLYTLLEDLETPESVDAFIILCIAAKAASRRWALAKAMLRGIQLTARKLAITLPPETDALFMDFETCDWSQKDRDGLSSLYPNFALRADGNEQAELDRFLERWDALGI